MASTQFLVYTNVQKFDPLRLLTGSIFFCEGSQAKKVPDMDKWSKRDSMSGSLGNQAKNIVLIETTKLHWVSSLDIQSHFCLVLNVLPSQQIFVWIFPFVRKGNHAVKAVNYYLGIYEQLLALNVKAPVSIWKGDPASPWKIKLCCQVKELWEEVGSLPSIKKDAKEIEIFTDNLKRQDPEPPAGMKKEQPEPMIICGANGDSQDRQDWKLVTSGNGRKGHSPPADLQWPE